MVCAGGIEPPYLLSPRFGLCIDLALPHLVRPLRSLTFTPAYSRSPSRTRSSVSIWVSVSAVLAHMNLRHLGLPVKITQGAWERRKVTMEVARLNRQGCVGADVVGGITRHVRIVEDHMAMPLSVRTSGVIEERRLIRHREDADVVRRLRPLAGLVRKLEAEIERSMRCLSDLQAWGEVPSDEDVLVLCL